LKSNTRVETDDRRTYIGLLTRLLNATEKKQTHYIDNITIRTRLVGSWTASVDFVQSLDFVDFDI